MIWRFILSNPYVAIGLVLAVVGAVVGYGEWRHHAGVVATDAAWEVRMVQQKAEANRLMMEGNARVIAAGRQFIELHVQIGKEYEDGQKKVAAVVADNVRLDGDIGRLLREQGRWLSGAYSVGGDPAATGNGPGGAAFAELLDALAGLVETGTGLADEADATALVGIACHADALGVRKIMEAAHGPRPSR